VRQQRPRLGIVSRGKNERWRRLIWRTLYRAGRPCSADRSEAVRIPAVGRAHGLALGRASLINTAQSSTIISFSHSAPLYRNTPGRESDSALTRPRSDTCGHFNCSCSTDSSIHHCALDQKAAGGPMQRWHEKERNGASTAYGGLTPRSTYTFPHTCYRTPFGHSTSNRMVV